MSFFTNINFVDFCVSTCSHPKNKGNDNTLFRDSNTDYNHLCFWSLETMMLCYMINKFDMKPSLMMFGGWEPCSQGKKKKGIAGVNTWESTWLSYPHFSTIDDTIRFQGFSMNGDFVTNWRQVDLNIVRFYIWKETFNSITIQFTKWWNKQFSPRYSYVTRYLFITLWFASDSHSCCKFQKWFHTTTYSIPYGKILFWKAINYLRFYPFSLSRSWKVWCFS